MTRKKKDSIHIILDLETLGIGTDALVTQVGAAEFSMETGEVTNVFNEKLDFDSLDNIEADVSVLRFWLRNEHNASMFKELIGTDNGGISPKEMWRKFSQWLTSIVTENETKDVKIWGNGISFDIEKVKYNIKKYNQPWALNYSNERDVRTIVDLATMITGENDYAFKKSVANDNPHDALADIIWEAAYISKAYHVIVGDKEIENMSIEVSNPIDEKVKSESESAWSVLDE